MFTILFLNVTSVAHWAFKKRLANNRASTFAHTHRQHRNVSLYINSHMSKQKCATFAVFKIEIRNSRNRQKHTNKIENNLKSFCTNLYNSKKKKIQPWPNVEWPNVEWPNIERPNVEWPNIERPNVEWPDVEWLMVEGLKVENDRT